MSESNPDFRGDGSSLSIEETNKIRLQLGLKPLEQPESDSNENTSAQKTDNFVHLPAKNIGDIKAKVKLEERIQMRKEARERNEFLSTVKSLGDDSVGPTSDFLKKVLDAKKASEVCQSSESDDQEQMDVDKIVEPKYGSNYLSGIAIEHKASRFDLTGPTVLTLKDKNILDEEDDDVLINVNLIDEEKAERNIRNKKMGLHGDFIDSGDEDDPLSSLKPTSVLAKYDETIDGIKRNRFILDSTGRYNMTQEKCEEEMRKKFFADKIRLVDGDVKIASDYFTPEEVRAKLKLKKRKCRGVRTTTKQPTAKVEKESPKVKKEEGELAEDEITKRDPTKVTKNTENNYSSDEDDYRPVLTMSELESTVINMELKHKLDLMKKSQPKVKAEVSQSQEEINADPASSSKKIVLTKTEEYTKSIYEILQSKRKNDADVAAQVKEEPIIKPILPLVPKIEEPKEEEPVQSSGWQPEEKILSLPPQPTKRKKNIREYPTQQQTMKKKLKLTDGVLGDEVQINSGIYSTLLLVKNKGYLDENRASTLISNPKNQMLRAQNFQEEKIRYDDIDQKCPRRDRRNLPEIPFQDKTDFIPDIKLDYHDEFGRPQPAKEAFRSLSHRFHGKTSGKIKSEKRYKKLQEQSKISSSIGDTEMKRVTKMQSKLKSENRYCVPLSGKNSIIPAAIKKSEKK